MGGKLEAGLQEPNDILLQRWHREAEQHRVKAFLIQGFLCTCGVQYNGDETEHLIEACVAKVRPAAQPQPTPDGEEHLGARADCRCACYFRGETDERHYQENKPTEANTEGEKP
jgi:hypothetical protein